jgi:hypothetical protein
MFARLMEAARPPAEELAATIGPMPAATGQFAGLELLAKPLGLLAAAVERERVEAAQFAGLVEQLPVIAGVLATLADSSRWETEGGSLAVFLEGPRQRLRLPVRPRSQKSSLAKAASIRGLSAPAARSLVPQRHSHWS